MINNNKYKLSLKNKLQGNKWYNIDARKIIDAYIHYTD